MSLQPCKLCGSHSVEEFEFIVAFSTDPVKMRDPVTTKVRCLDCGTVAAKAVWQREPLPFNEAAEREAFENEMVQVFRRWRERGNAAEDNGCPCTREALCWREPDGSYGVLALNMAWTGWLRRALR